MSIAITELMKACKPGVGMPCGLAMDMVCAGYGQILLDKGFYFLLVANGTASVSDVHASYTLASLHLLVVTPSIRVTLADMSADFRMVCLYIEPDYFDTLSVGQLVYGQVSQFVGNYLLPIFQLEAEQADYLQKTLVLFSSRLEELHLYRDGIVRHLCSFFLLQMADALYQKNRETAGFANRSTEIFVTSSVCWCITTANSTTSVSMLTVCTFLRPTFRVSCAISRGIRSVSTYPNCFVPMRVNCWSVPTRM